MTHRVPLPDGAWADLRTKEEITVKGRRNIQSIAASLADVLPKLKDIAPEDMAETDMSSLGMNEQEMDAFLRLQEATVVAFLAGWSLPDPIPTLMSVGDLATPLFDALSKATADDGAAVAKLTLDTGVGDGNPDPKDPSGNSEPSDGPLKEEVVPSSTLT